ncbi:MAG: hypothetical protein AB2L14_13260 [Candidatus Xenobiia bacterium LiM19]
MQSIGNIRAASDYVMNSSGSARISELEEQKKEILQRLDDYRKQEIDLELKGKESKKIFEQAEKKSVTCRYGIWGTVAATVASCTALGFICLPALPVVAAGGTLASCMIYKKKELHDRMLFMHGEHGFLNGKMDMELLKMGRSIANDELKKTEKELSELNAGRADKLSALEKSQSEPSQELVVEDPDEKFIIIDGIKLPKKSLEYMTADMRAYVRGREL